MTEYQHHWSSCLWMFSPFGKGQTEEDIIGHWKKLDRQQGGCPALASEIEAASFAILQQIRNSTAWSVKLTWQPVFRASIQFFVVLDAYNQSSCESSVILMVHSSLLVFRYFHLFRQNTLTWSRVRLVTSSKHTEVKVLFTMFSGLESLDPTLAVHLNFCNFRNFRI